MTVKYWVNIDFKGVMTKYRRKELASILKTTEASINNFRRLNRMPLSMYKDNKNTFEPFISDFNLIDTKYKNCMNCKKWNNCDKQKTLALDGRVICDDHHLI